jgi:peptidoglycan/xylan/chitin deacetylase (PgdA/CDA1 family)
MRLLVPYLATHALRPAQRFFPDLLWRVETQTRTAYLTFDDGPTPELTRPLLDRLAQHNARATHFLIGRHAQEHPQLVRAIVDAGHRIGNHTFTHADPWRTSDASLRREVDRTTAVLEDIAGRRVRALRPPYGHPTGALRSWCATHQQRMVMWDVMPGDYLQTATTDRVARFVVNHVRPGSVIVLHDNPTCSHVTPEALDIILDTLTSRGWAFDAL